LQQPWGAIFSEPSLNNPPVANASRVRSKELFDALMQKGISHFDVIDMHLYADDLEDVAAACSWIKAECAVRGINKPIWSTGAKS
jgi:hypothetical protein